MEKLEVREKKRKGEEERDEWRGKQESGAAEVNWRG